MRYLLFLSLLLTYCTPKDTPEAAAESDSGRIELLPGQSLQAGIRVSKPEKRLLAGTLQTTGRVNTPPDRRIRINIPLGGTVTRIDLLPGQPVKKGQLLITLTDLQYLTLKEEYLSAALEKSWMELELERIKVLREQDASLEKQFKKLENDAARLRLKHHALAAKLTLLGIQPASLSPENLNAVVEIVSDVQGFVGQLYVNRGDRVGPESVLLELIDTSDLHLLISVLETDVPLLGEELPFTAETPGLPGRTFTGKLLVIGKQLNQRGQMDIHANFDQPWPELFPGLFMNVSIRTKNTYAMAVSSEAVVQLGSAFFVFGKIDSLHFQAYPVRTGPSADGYTAVYGDLPDSLVSAGAYALLMKWKNTAEED